MKSNYSFNAELISSKEFTVQQLEKVKADLESEDRYSHFTQIFLDNLEINFSGHAEIYVEEYPFELDLSSDIESMVKDMDKVIPGGWSSDSKIEFISIMPPITYVWYKDNKGWKETSKELSGPESFFSPWEDSQDDYSQDRNYPDYDEDSDW